MIRRGQVWQADLGQPRGSRPAYTRPVVILQADVFNKTAFDSFVIAIATSNLRLADMPGNVLVKRGIGGFREDSVVNITQLFTIDKTDLVEHLGSLPKDTLRKVDDGLRLSLSLPSGE